MKRLIFTGFLFFLALARQTAYAQGLLGTILGTVSDSSGAAVGDVNVTVKNQATNLQVGGKTQSNELYQIPNLPIGTYSVTFRSPDSKSKTTPISSCRRSGRRPSTARFTWGAVSTTVEVKGTPLLNETDPTNGYILDSHTIQETPLGTGSFTQLAILSPGVNADFPGGASSNTGLGNMAIWANGQRDSSNSFVIDGVNADNLFNGKSTSQVDSTRFTSNTGQSSTVGGESRTNVSVFDGFGQSLPSPPQESLEEIRVNTEMYDATQNAKSGAHISLIAKSGSNTFHFEAYECFQNTIFNAAAFFRNANTSIVASQKVAPLHCNRPGGTFGGPIIRDKLFFGSYQTLRISDNLAGTQTATVPQSLTDDRSAAGLAAVAQASLGVTVAQSQIDPAAVKIMNAKVGGSWFIPNPTITDPVAAKQLGYNVTVTGTPSTSKANIGTGSIDYNWAERERLTGRVLYQDSPNYNPYGGGTAINGFGKSLDSGSELGSIDNTTIVSPNLTWENKLGLVRMRSYADTQQPFTPGDLGVNLWGLSTFPQIALGTVDTNLNNIDDYGYPSGHATTGYLEALALVQMVPEKRDAILARADDYAHSRVVCGVHYPSDTAAGKLVAYSMMGIMMINPQFRKELEAAKAETRKALGL